METRKTLIYFIILATSIVGLKCKTINDSTSQKTTYSASYVDQFKLTYFRQILIKSYNYSKEIEEIIKSDHSGFTEAILTKSDYNLIDSLTTADNEKIKTDSSESYRRAEGSEGKRPLGYILDRINSKWLDSLANERYKISEIKLKHQD